MVAEMTPKEYALHRCALMILRDECPPDRKHYLCMREEDELVCDCVKCWYDYVWGVSAGAIELPSK